VGECGQAGVKCIGDAYTMQPKAVRVNARGRNHESRESHGWEESGGRPQTVRIPLMGQILESLRESPHPPQSRRRALPLPLPAARRGRGGSEQVPVRPRGGGPGRGRGTANLANLTNGKNLRERRGRARWGGWMVVFLRRSNSPRPGQVVRSTPRAGLCGVPAPWRGVCRRRCLHHGFGVICDDVECADCTDGERLEAGGRRPRNRDQLDEDAQPGRRAPQACSG